MRRVGWVLLALFVLCSGFLARAANRSAFVLVDAGVNELDYRVMAYDAGHGQLFLAWALEDRIDVISAADYHLIHSIAAPSPVSIDISPDGTTLAVGSMSSHVLFFSTSTFEKTNDVVIPGIQLGIAAFVYAANGNAFVLDGGDPLTARGTVSYWDHLTGSVTIPQIQLGAPLSGPFETVAVMARSGDYSRVMLGDASTGGVVQILDANTGKLLQQTQYNGFVAGLAINKDASRSAVCIYQPNQGNYLTIQDGSYNQIYQDDIGCGGMAFSGDGQSLYRDVGNATQALNMTNFSAHNTTNLFSGPPLTANSTVYQASDTTGMAYGFYQNLTLGVAFVAIDTTQSTTPTRPVLSDPVGIVRLMDTVGSPQGGDQIRMETTGLDTATASQVTVTVGGASAPVVNLSMPVSINRSILTVTTPKGTPGLADVVVTGPGGTATAAGAFQYAQNRTIFPFATSPTYLLYDAGRKKLYASHGSQVEVIDPVAQKVLTPLTPVGGRQAGSQFAGLSLSPDGKRLYIADPGTGLIHLLYPDAPGTGMELNPAKAVGSIYPLTLDRAFETSTGQLVGSGIGISPFTMDPSTGTGGQFPPNTPYYGWFSGYTWNTTNAGRYLLVETDVNDPDAGAVGLWDAQTGIYTPGAAPTLSIPETTANEDGTVIAVGGSSEGSSLLNPQLLDFAMSPLGSLEQQFDVVPPFGTPGLVLDASGALMYTAGQATVGDGPGTGVMEIQDTHLLQPAAGVVFPEQFLTLQPGFSTRMLEIDNTGRTLFGVTQSGITMMVLYTLPLSVGNVQPAFGTPAGGAALTIRGSGFEPGVTATLGGQALALTYVDENTLTATAPALASGWQDLTVTNAGGSPYTAPGIFHVLGSQTSPKITGFSPAAVPIGLAFNNPFPVTIVGSGFDLYDTVLINGEPVEAVYLDAEHMGATIPGTLTAQTGSVTVTVVSPFTGASNTQTLALVNPAPVLQQLFPEALIQGSSMPRLNIVGANLAPNTVLEWNGQMLTSFAAPGVNPAGVDVMSVDIPANLLVTAGTAKLTLFTPGPGGGTSNAVSITVAPAEALLSAPASIAYGLVLPNQFSSQTVNLWNYGSGAYTLSSATVSSPFYSVVVNQCTGVPSDGYCTLTLTLDPTTTGPANAVLTIVDNAPGSPHAIPITATVTNTLAPTVAITSIQSIGQDTTATVFATATVGGPGIGGRATLQLSTDPAMANFSSPTVIGFAGDSPVTLPLTGLSEGTKYYVRVQVVTEGGTGLSAIASLATNLPPAYVSMLPTSTSTTTVALTAGQTATYQLNANDGANGFSGTATLLCLGAPKGAVCTVTPSSFTVGESNTLVTVTVTTGAATITTAEERRSGSDSGRIALAMGMLFGTGAIAFRRRRGAGLWVCVLGLSLALCGSVMACGGGSGSGTGTGGGGGPQPNPNATPPGTYSLLIVATTGGVQTSLPLTLTVN